MEYFWSPSEPNIVRFPKPEGVESYPVDMDTFVIDAAVVVTDGNGVKSVAHDPVKLDAFVAKERARKEKVVVEQQKDVAKKIVYQKIKDIASFEDVKAVLFALASIEPE